MNMRSAWFIAVKDTQFMLREKETILWTFVMPIIFFYFIGTVTGGFTNSGSSGVRDSLALESPLAGGRAAPQRLLWVPSQKGLLPEFLHPQKWTVSSLSGV